MPAVFISYSRKDFYFAESLAFHLTECGIESWLDANHLTPGGEWGEEIDRALDEAHTVVLVATPASMRSPYVEREWKRALAQGDRLIVALFRSCKLPPEMEPARVVDFRGSFRPALRRLTALLAEPRQTTPCLTTASRVPRLPRLPPLVGLMMLMLFSVFLAPLAIFGDWQGLNLEEEPIGFRIFAWIMLPFFFGLFAWHGGLAFLWRRMGLTRLTLTLLLFTGVFSLYLIGRTGWVPAITALTSGIHYDAIPSSILASIVGVGWAAVAIVTLLRPEDLLRWCPTGKAWDAYRRGRVMQIPDLPTRFAELGRFQLLHDAEDAPAAAQLRSDLIGLGASESPAEGTRVILLTNRSTTEWLSGQAALLEKGAVTVIGSAIGLPASLHWLWRRQWSDLRRWDATRRRKNPVPAVPEGMTRLRLPGIVNLNEHLLCAMAGLLLVLANVLPSESSNSETLTAREGFGGVIAIAAICWIVAASKLIHPTFTQPRFRRWVGLLAWMTLPLAAGEFYFFISLGGNVWRAVPAIFFVVALPFLLRWQTARLAFFWFPAPPGPGVKFPPRLNAPRKWDALLWALLYMALWMVLLGVD